ncbi:MAG TPA: hypothetical protein VED40_07780 [Azospirillaceae bacterium]|nr:hypothetical protein [Azospirillaceae bacterium]
MIEPIMSDLGRVGVLVHVEPGPDAGVLRPLLEAALLAEARRSFTRVPVEPLPLADGRLLEADRVTLVLHATPLASGSVVPGTAGTLLLLSLRRFRHDPRLPPGAVVEAPPVALHLPGPPDAGALREAVGRLLDGTLGRRPAGVRKAPKE